MKVDLYVLNYNGEAYISDCLLSLEDAIRESKHDCRLVVIDNSSTDSSVSVIQKRFPHIQILKMKNRFLCSFNDAVAESAANIVFLLNNDLKADRSFIDPMVSVFEEKKDVFLVSAKSFLLDGSYEGGLSIPLFRLGLFESSCQFQGYEKKVNCFGYTFSAGFGAFDRTKFLSLKGYDDLYFPGRMEDSDLLFRSWRKGWKSYYQPKSILYHVGGKSFKERFGVRGTMEIAHKNTFLFIWKNIHDKKFLIQHILFLIPRMLWMLLNGRFEFVTAFFKALRELGEALRRRDREKKIPYQLTDRQVISFFEHGN